MKSLHKHYRIADGQRFELASVDPADTCGIDDADRGRDLRKQNTEALLELQDRLYAEHRWSLLLIFQAMDAGGKDGTIRDVMSGLNPQGCHVASFKVPSDEELDHDFMWRYLRRLPERGKIGIFNRSYYEDVLVPRVHREVMDKQRLPPRLVSKQLWSQRLDAIGNVERYLSENGVVICKFFLHISKQEQRKRLLARLDDPQKNWKFDVGDIQVRRFWKDYMRCYQDAIRATASEHAPWYVIPADHKWFARLVVSSVVTATLAGLQLDYPRIDARKIAVARKALRATP
jgi:PPK2 family polyphosphate:nucleotide phosphotransferase